MTIKSQDVGSPSHPKILRRHFVTSWVFTHKHKGLT